MPIVSAFPRARSAQSLATDFQPSGYWGGSGSIFTSRTNQSPAPLFPTVGVGVPNRYLPNATSTGTTTPAGYNPLAITKNPWLKDFVTGLQSDLSKTSMPDFTQVLNSLKNNRSGVDAAFDRYGNAVNLDDYIAAQRGGDAELRARTNAMAGDVGALSNRYSGVLSDYENRGAGALGAELGNAQDFTNRLIPQAISDAYSNVQKNAKLYDFASPGGYSSGLAGKIARESTSAALPFMLEGSRYTGNVLGKYLPFYGDVASRQAGKISGFDYPAAAAMYDRYGNLIAGEKGTAANIQQLQMAVAREGVDMAIKRYVTDFQSAQMLAQAANLPVEVIMQRAQAAGALGGMSPLYQYEGLQGPDAFLQSPTGFNNSLPGYPPSRYQNTQTATPGNAQQGTGLNAAGWQDWNSLWNTNQLGPQSSQASSAARNYLYTPQGRQDYLEAYGQPPPTRYTSVPFDPNRVSGGWGYVNGQYIGKDAEEWNQPWPVGT